jgi:xylulokinase
VMEGVVFSLADCLGVMTELGVSVRQVRAIGGGARNALWRQILADVLGLPIHRTAVDEGPAYGAALLAAVTAGIFTSVQEACSVVKLRPEVTEPDAARAAVYKEYFDVYRSLYPVTSKTMARLSHLTGQ